MVRPAVRRQAVCHVQSVFGLSERGACRALGMARATHRYKSRREPQDDLLGRLRKLAAARPRAGYRMLVRILRREGVGANHKRIYRIYRQEGLSIRVKRRKRLAASPRQVLWPVTKANDRWAMDFVSDSTTDGHRFRILTLIDTFTRRAPGVVVERSIGGHRVARFLDQVAAKLGFPRSISVDNGPEFISNALDQWAHAHDVQLHFSRPGRPVDNAFIESFNGRLRDECLNTNWFYGLEQAREVIAAWLEDYNECRPHGSLGGLTPLEYEKAQLRTPRPD
jgi:putative transposase